MTIRTAGIAADLDAAAGIRHLTTVGSFDEVASGQGWENAAAAPWVSGQFAGPRATPQLLVLALTRQYDDSTLRGNSVIVNQRLVKRLVGLNEISEWAASAAPTPALTWP